MLPRCTSRLQVAFVLFACLSSRGYAEEPTLSVGKLVFEFASVETGKKILTSRDDYTNRLSPFDFQSRTQSATPVAFEEYVEFVSNAVVPWNEGQTQKLTKVLEGLAKPLAQYEFNNLPRVVLIQTSGREESDAAYTRANAIILTKSQLQMPIPPLRKLVLHELFHVISRNDSELRDQLYGIIGFRATNEIDLPKSFQPLRITNPDAPIIQHVMTVKVGEQNEQTVAPVLYAKSTYNPKQSRSMFAYLQFALMQVALDDQGHYVASLRDGEPIFHRSTLPDFHRQIGANTGYIIHPEEILADNFSELLTGNTSVPDPWVLDKMRAILTASAKPAE
jgi:hypothetical protein